MTDCPRTTQKGFGAYGPFCRRHPPALASPRPGRSCGWGWWGRQQFPPTHPRSADAQAGFYFAWRASYISTWQHQRRQRAADGGCNYTTALAGTIGPSGARGAFSAIFGVGDWAKSSQGSGEYWKVCFFSAICSNPATASARVW